MSPLLQPESLPAGDLRPLVFTRRPEPQAAERWRDYGWTGPPDPAGMEADYASLVAALGGAGATVVSGVVPAPGNPDAIYVRDPVLMVDAGAVLLRPGKALRRQEPAGLAADLERLGVPVVGSLEDPATAEGGDMFFLNSELLLVGRSYRTNDAGISFLRQLLPGVEIQGFDLPHLRGNGEVLHLMSLLSLVTAELAVGYLPLLPVRLVQLLAAVGVSLLPVSDEEFETMGANVLGLPGRRAVALRGNPQIQKAMEASGVEVHLYSGSELSIKGAGGPTCLTLPLSRGLA